MDRKNPPPPELSIIIPVFNEYSSLQKLFSGLSEQERVSFEIIIADGGSSDNTREKARKLAVKYSLTVTVVISGKGRGRQMNRGARAARGRTLLFLHADSAFDDNLALFTGLKELLEEILSLESENVAGRFSLVFSHLPGYDLSRELSLAYHYYENKARLERTECINGDQGMLLTHSFWKKTGHFNETFPFLEDREFAERVAKNGRWKLLSPSILTSSRRFFQEGMKERQTLNAIVMNFFSIGRMDFIDELPGIYKNQDKTKKMRMYPFFTQIRGSLSGFSLQEQMIFWYRSGAYILQNAWQIAFYMDIKREFSAGGKKGKRPLLGAYEKVVKKLILNTCGKVITTILVWGWFHIRYLRKK